MIDIPNDKLLNVTSVIVVDINGDKSVDTISIMLVDRFIIAGATGVEMTVVPPAIIIRQTRGGSRLWKGGCTLLKRLKTKKKKGEAE